MTTTTPIAVRADQLSPATIAEELAEHGITTWMKSEQIAAIEARGYCLDFDTYQIIPADDEENLGPKPWITLTFDKPETFSFLLWEPTTVR